MQLHQPPVLAELAALNARLLILSFAALPRLQQWKPHFETNFLRPYYQENHLEWPTSVFARTTMLADPTLSVYHAYGLGRNSVLRVYGPAILGKYARWFVQGKPIQWPTEDPLQRGGDFVVSDTGRLTLAYVGRDQSDRPTVTAILAALRQKS